uniref:Uncharacterized protein n=1 Tax=Salmo trutta TaxID=8032 RepID=A0A673X3U2_SALTR
MCNVFQDATTRQPRTLAGGQFAGIQKKTWSSGVMDCCVDRDVCLCGFFCPCIQAIKMAEKYGECFLLSHVPWTHFMLRTSIRERYNIEGSICDDWCMTAFCGPCVQCQMVREVNKEIPN